MRPDSSNPAAPAIGQHLLAELRGIAPDRLRDEGLLREVLVEGLTRAGFTILDTRFHKFTSGGCGVTGVALLSESHAAFHTYPEYEYMALDVFSCGAQDPHLVLRVIVDRLEPTACQCHLHARGL